MRIGKRVEVDKHLAAPCKTLNAYSPVAKHPGPTMHIRPVSSVRIHNPTMTHYHALCSGEPSDHRDPQLHARKWHTSTATMTPPRTRLAFTPPGSQGAGWPPPDGLPGLPSSLLSCARLAQTSRGRYRPANHDYLLRIHCPLQIARCNLPTTDARPRQNT